MAESLNHMNYVRRIVAYLPTIRPNYDSLFLSSDLPDSNLRPSATMDGFIPDVVYRDSSIVIIGEAKTENDIENEHTLAQLRSYINEVRCFNGERHIILCSSVTSFALIKNTLLRKKNREQINDITFHVLDNLQKVAII